MPSMYRCPSCDSLTQGKLSDIILTSYHFNLDSKMSVTIDFQCPDCKHNLHVSLYGGEVQDMGE